MKVLRTIVTVLAVLLTVALIIAFQPFIIGMLGIMQVFADDISANEKWRVAGNFTFWLLFLLITLGCWYARHKLTAKATVKH